jgi:hypothetical protein
MAIKLGTRVRDPLTGFEGLAQSKRQRTCIGIKADDAQPGQELPFFDEARLEEVPEGE